jgi:hypothetical protein
MLGWTGTGVVIPEAIAEEFDIQPDHYLEVILHTVKKNGQQIPIYPGKMVEREIRKAIVEPHGSGPLR